MLNILLSIEDYPSNSCIHHQPPKFFRSSHSKTEFNVPRIFPHNLFVFALYCIFVTCHILYNNYMWIFIAPGLCSSFCIATACYDVIDQKDNRYFNAAMLQRDRWVVWLRELKFDPRKRYRWLISAVKYHKRKLHGDLQFSCLRFLWCWTSSRLWWWGSRQGSFLICRDMWNCRRTSRNGGISNLPRKLMCGLEHASGWILNLPDSF